MAEVVCYEAFPIAHLTVKLHAIELRQKVYDVANAYFGIPSANTTITIADANQHLYKIEDNSTDILFADMYGSINMNPFQTQKSFVHQSYRVLSKKGWLVINYHELPDLETDFFETLFNSFSEIFVCQTTNKNNTILFANKKQLTIPLQHYESPITTLEKRLEVKISPLFKRLTQIHPIRN